MMRSWPQKPIAFDEAVELVSDRLFIGPHQQHPSINALPPTIPKVCRGLLDDARALLFEALATEKLTLWVRIIRPAADGGKLEQPMAPLSFSKGQDGRVQTGYWKAMRLRPLGRMENTDESKIIWDIYKASLKVLDQIEFGEWLNGKFSTELSEGEPSPGVEPKKATKNELKAAIECIVDEVLKSEWPYLSFDDVDHLVREECEKLHRWARRDTLRDLFWTSGVRPDHWPKRKGNRVRLQDGQIEHLRHVLRERLREIFSLA